MLGTIFWRCLVCGYVVGGQNGAKVVEGAGLAGVGKQDRGGHEGKIRHQESLLLIV